MELSKRVALDAMGGDFGVPITVAGAIAAAREKGVHTVLVGDEERIESELKRQGAFGIPEVGIMHAPDCIGMEEHAAASVRRKPAASINVAFDLLNLGTAGAVVSAGNSGAVMASAITKVKRIAEIERPALTIAAPIVNGTCVFLDVGANVDCKPTQIVQFAIMGEAFARLVLGKKRPSVGLLSNGKEETKGNELTRLAHEILKTLDIHYVGYVEGRDIFFGIDVVVSDGFVGNIVLKVVEGFVEAGAEIFKEEFRKGFFSKLFLPLVYACFRHKMHNIKRRFDYAEYGAAPLLGINGIGLVCHGSSNAKAIKNALILAQKSIENHFLEGLREELSKLPHVGGISLLP